ncbi:MAG TPA: PQQ-dependent sugar dehydrogenase [Gemmatimonadaceae bacterium]|nr:PQQ-dependent sugar dehydrogenase [Gemmatimonadaceae bacterium]
MPNARSPVICLAVFLAAISCTPKDSGSADTVAATGAAATDGNAAKPCPAGTDTAITLPAGFCAVVFADSVIGSRHIAVASNGDVFVQRVLGRRTGDSTAKGGIMAFRDANADGRADTTARFGQTNGTGIGLYRGWIYADDGSRIVRFTHSAGSLTPSGNPETVIRDIPMRGHDAHNFVIDSAGTLYLNIGSRTNNCQQQDRANESPGINPCVELETRAGIWRFQAEQLGQRPSVASRFATGIRNGMGLAINPADGKLYATQHGRDQLFQNWPKLFTAQQNAANPAEELQQLNQGDDFGWPYCFYSIDLRRRVLAPEYGGNGTEVGQCASKKAPAAVFPAHWAPMSLVFYTGNQFPPRYRGGAFIAMHGSWNRAPEPQDGYNLTFVPMVNGAFSNHEVFARGFPGATVQPDRAVHRPTGVAQSPDGGLYLTDDKGGRIWKIVYVGTQ